MHRLPTLAMSHLRHNVPTPPSSISPSATLDFFSLKSPQLHIRLHSKSTSNANLPVTSAFTISPTSSLSSALTSSQRSTIKPTNLPRTKIPEADLTERFLKGSGPGGQKINKTASAVQLRHLPTGTIIKTQASRSRSRNRQIARKLLAEKLEEMELGSESKRGKRRERERNRKRSKAKKARRKYGIVSGLRQGRPGEKRNGVLGIEGDREDEDGDEDEEYDEDDEDEDEDEDGDEDKEKDIRDLPGMVVHDCGTNTSGRPPSAGETIGRSPFSVA